MTPVTKKLQSPAGAMACWDSEKDAAAVLFVHGNSASKDVFIHQFTSPLLQEYRLVAIDLPGHGVSDDVDDINSICDIQTYAQTIASVIPALGLKDTTLVGWSLGGHFCIEIAAQNADIAGLVLTGTPPCGPGINEIAEAFTSSAEMALTGQAVFSDKDVLSYCRAIYNNENVPDILIAATKRTQGGVRQALFANFANPDCGAHNQKNVVANTDLPIAVIQGEDDYFMSLDYFKKLKWNSLWRDEVAVIKNSGHAPFLEKPEEYNQLLSDFLKEQTQGSLYNGNDPLLSRT